METTKLVKVNDFVQELYINLKESGLEVELSDLLDKSVTSNYVKVVKDMMIFTFTAVDEDMTKTIDIAYDLNNLPNFALVEYGPDVYFTIPSAFELITTQPKVSKSKDKKIAMLSKYIQKVFAKTLTNIESYTKEDIEKEVSEDKVDVDFRNTVAELIQVTGDLAERVEFMESKLYLFEAFIKQQSVINDMVSNMLKVGNTLDLNSLLNITNTDSKK